MHLWNKKYYLADLDVGSLAKGFGLLHLPRMPELKGRKFPNFKPVDINLEKIPYK